MNERERAITNLMAVDLSGGSHEMLSSIAKTIYEPTFGWTIGACQVLRDTLVNLLSETDEEALREAYTKGREDGMGMANAKDAHAEYLRGRNDGYDEGWDAGFASADDWCAQHEDAMNEHGWVKLPKDADGEYIHIGDLMEWIPYDSSYPSVISKVVAVGVCVFFAWSDEKQGYAQYEALAYRHYHAPTVEDVLEELLREYDRDDSELTNGEIIERFAAKLRLAGDAE